MTLSGGLYIGEPVGSFDQTYGRELIGVGGNFSVPMRRLPFESGLAFSWQSMGGDDDIVSLDSTFSDAEGTLRVKANMYSMHALVRFNPLRGNINPYFDVLGGFRTFSTRTKVKVDDVSGNVINERNERDYTFSGGWAVGLMYTVTSNIYVEGRYEKLNGGKVTYVDPESITITPGGLVTYESRTTTSDLFNIVIGFGFKF
jgi:opacity protein-like surface antigen